jgi:hypothetical protein
MLRAKRGTPVAGLTVNLVYSGTNIVQLSFQASPGVTAGGEYNIGCTSTNGVFVAAGILLVNRSACQNATVAIQTQADGSGRKFTFNQLSGTGVFAAGFYTPNQFVSSLRAVASSQGGTFLWSVDNTSMVQFVNSQGVQRLLLGSGRPAAID